MLGVVPATVLPNPVPSLGAWSHLDRTQLLLAPLPERQFAPRKRKSTKRCEMLGSLPRAGRSALTSKEDVQQFARFRPFA
jgi:hypothetical protein